MDSIERLTAIKEFNTQVSRIVDMVADYLRIITSALTDIHKSSKKPIPLFLFNYHGYKLEKDKNDWYIIIKENKIFPSETQLIGTDNYMNLEEVLKFAEIAPDFLLHFIQMLAT